MYTQNIHHPMLFSAIGFVLFDEELRVLARIRRGIQFFCANLQGR